jgi:hypothetical protein
VNLKKLLFRLKHKVSTKQLSVIKVLAGEGNK